MTPLSPVYYIDESIYSKVLIQKLLDIGVQIEHVGVAVPFGSPDEDWLRLCGENGWLVLTRDQRIRYRKLERDTLKEFGVGAFTFVGGQATGPQMATCISSLIPRMNRKSLSDSRPFLYTLYLRPSGQSLQNFHLKGVSPSQSVHWTITGRGACRSSGYGTLKSLPSNWALIAACSSFRAFSAAFCPSPKASARIVLCSV